MGMTTEELMLLEANKKSGLVAALLNIFIPGAGYMYCGRWVLGIFAMVFVIGFVVVSLGYLAGGLWLMLIIDGFLCAGRYNKDLLTSAIAKSAAN